jgi:hypothetical protein
MPGRQQRECFVGVRSFQHMIAIFTKHIASEEPDENVVFNEQDNGITKVTCSANHLARWHSAALAEAICRATTYVRFRPKADITPAFV